MKRASVIFIALLALFGLADSVYLAQHAANGAPLVCNIQNLSDCNAVATSSYSQIFGIPIADIGVFFYGLLFVLAALEFFIFNKPLRRTLQGLALFGLLGSIYSTFIQAFFIQAWCIYCLASAFTSLVIFILATLIEPIRRKTEPPVPPMPSPFPMPPQA